MGDGRFADFDAAFHRGVGAAHRPPASTSRAALVAWRALVARQVPAAAVLRLLRLAEESPDLDVSAAAASDLVAIAGDLTRSPTLGRSLAARVSGDDLAAVVLHTFAQHHASIRVTDGTPGTGGDGPAAGSSQRLLTRWALLVGDFHREYGIDLSGRDLAGLSWRAFIDRVAGLSTRSRWALAAVADRDSDNVVHLRDRKAAQAYFDRIGG